MRYIYRSSLCKGSSQQGWLEKVGQEEIFGFKIDLHAWHFVYSRRQRMSSTGMYIEFTYFALTARISTL